MIVFLEEHIKSVEDPAHKEALEEFQYITLVENFIEEDSESFLQLEDYLRLLDEIVVLTGLSIENVTGTVADERFVFTFEMGAKLHSFSIPAATGDWFDESFTTAFNEVLGEAGLEKGIYNVFVGGLKFANQILHLVYLNVEIFEELSRSKYGFVWNEDAEGQIS